MTTSSPAPLRDPFSLFSWPGLSRSLLIRIGGAIAAISILTVVGMSASGLVAESTQGSGEAINRAGSLRMQSWYLASLYLADQAENRDELKRAISGFEATLDAPSIMAILPRGGDADLYQTYRQIGDEWRDNIRPVFVAATEGRPRAEGARLVTEVRRFVGLIDLLVKQMEESTEAKIKVMRMVLYVTLVLTILVVLLTGWLIHTHLVLPLQALVGLTTRLGQGNLAVRTTYTGEDELGQLGRAFNLMAEDLSKLYVSLEERVRLKTAELTRSNQSLELLYHSIARLHGAPPGEAVYQEVLGDIESVLEVGHGIICLGVQGGKRGQAVASTMLPGDANPCDKAECLWCHDSNKTRFSIKDGFHQHLTLPLADAEQQYGVLLLEIPSGRHMESWQVQLLEALSRHIGVAIGAERRIEQSRRLALLEERAVIARELHDSLAQSLAYMRIQVSRMKTVMRQSGDLQQQEAVLDELREGLNSSYQQLRELLSTFRLKMEDAPLAKVLADTVAEFSARGGIHISLAIDTCPLSPNEEIHVLHIVREALSNVLHHANANNASVSLTCDSNGQIEVRVEDDGRGIAKPADLHHYGMTIMEERARTLHGELSYENRPQGGTQVMLRFTSNRRKGKEPSGQHTEPTEPL